MRVTLCVEALTPNPGGIGRYTWQLSRGLLRRPEIDLRYYGRRRLLKDPSALLRGERLQPQRFRLMQSWWNSRAMRNGLFHATNYFLPPSVEGIISVHDLSVFKHSDTHPIERVKAFDREFWHSLRRAKHIITDTETVRSELINEFDVSPALVTAVHLGVDDRFNQRSDDTDHAIFAALGLQSGSYGLCVSTLEPRKKVAELVAAWRRLPAHVRNSYPLALAGGKGWLSDALQADISQGMSEGWLRYLGFVEDEMLPALYRGARLFIYPSIYEGFGLPPLEAMASGTPAIVSSRSCMPEVCGDAVRYVDPEDPDDMLRAISDCLVDVDWQREAAKRGVSQSSKFNWDRCVDDTIAVYRKAT